jgi:tight adherence protein B
MTVQAGEGSTVTQLVSSSSIAAVTGVMAAWFLFGGWGTLLGLLPGFLPLVILQRRIQARSMKLTEQLPEALDLISRALRAGHAFNDALRTAGAELPAPLGAELTHTSEEHRLGLSMRGCLDNLVERLPDNFEMRFFVSSVMLQRETGGNLVEILETISETVRERVIFEGKVEALTAEVRMSALILQLLPVGAAVILFIMEPQYLMPLIEPGLGRTMLGAAVALMATGSYVMRRISTVEF